MTDVFISYAREDQALAEALANDLGARGFAVWWDSALVGSDDFYEVILEALNKAKAAIVIWSQHSAKSRFVRDEARFALHCNKLVAAKTTGLDVLEIPFGFQGQHTDDVSNREHLVRAIEKLGVRPAVSPGATPAALAARWQELKASTSAHEVLDFLAADPPEAERLQAIARLKHLIGAPKDSPKPREPSADVKALTKSNWQAFWEGLTFRLPSFQLSTQGYWASIGLVISNVLLTALLVFLSLVFLGSTLDTKDVWVQSVPGIVFALLAWFAWARFSRLVDQRNFAASIVLATLFVVMTSFAGLIVFNIAEVREQQGGASSSAALASIAAFAWLAATVAAVVMVVRKIRSAR